MEHIAALLLIVGCSATMTECKELPVATSLYEADGQCEADLQPVISRFVTKHPQVFGTCVLIDPAMDDEDAELVWSVRPEGTLVATIEPFDFVVASTATAGDGATGISQ